MLACVLGFAVPGIKLRVSHKLASTLPQSNRQAASVTGILKGLFVCRYIVRSEQRLELQYHTLRKAKSKHHWLEEAKKARAPEALENILSLNSGLL